MKAVESDDTYLYTYIDVSIRLVIGVVLRVSVYAEKAIERFRSFARFCESTRRTDGRTNGRKRIDQRNGRSLAVIPNFDRDDPVAAFIRRAIKNVDGNVACKNINDSGVFAGARKQGTCIGALRRRKPLAGSDRVVT